MDISQTITAVAAAALVPIITWGMNRLTQYLDAKIDEINNREVAGCVKRAVETVEQCVLYVMQTYVDGLKNEGSFGREAQARAFEKARDSAARLIDEKSKAIIANEYGSFSEWLVMRIEQTVKESKGGGGRKEN